MKRILYASLLLLLCNGFSHASSESHLEYLVDLLDAEGQLAGLEEEIRVDAVVTRFYRRRGFKTIWDNPARAERMLDELNRSREEGLNPEDYHYSYLRKLQAELISDNSGRNAEFELLMTDALFIYGYHLLRGKVDPRNMEASWNYTEAEIEEDEVINRISLLADDGGLLDRFIQLKPDDLLTNRLRRGLYFFRDLQAKHPFEMINDNPLLKPGESQSVVNSIRKRLMQLTLLHDEGGQGDQYDDGLATAVKQFQRLHNLDADGVIGGGTWRALNMSWQDRINILRINLERSRWINRSRDTKKFVLVNIAGYQLYVVDDGKLIWNTDIMVGAINRETPIFQSEITYLEFNPTWTVPRSIVNRSLLNNFLKNPGYIKENDFILLDRSGISVNPETLDWTILNRNNFPYTVVQQPGEKNALGQVKFIFPNSRAIYLHDTPARALFSKSTRAFSAGCVRVKNPFELARILLNDESQWNLDQIQAVIDEKKRKRVYLNDPVSVMLMYWTVEPNGARLIKFNPDIYNRDAKLLKALDAPI